MFLHIFVFYKPIDCKRIESSVKPQFLPLNIHCGVSVLKVIFFPFDKPTFPVSAT